ncbi:hypothetical protein K458DRAFT_96426 [Lentithecium fluviatile CBS 122367]|uniref:Uncharacterized protein n=1 Tax=Lentithecium fluviatile CBS 122367 TaxID=1168545 RepID=A0A6G1JHI5_9PLEO|nr:hypothetical protein K458DRAFT_96426 [Lentithecium fluviatile CBS 122367]
MHALRGRRRQEARFQLGVHSRAEAGFQYPLIVADAEPIFFYSSVGDACNASAMVGVINPVCTPSTLTLGSLQPHPSHKPFRPPPKPSATKKTSTRDF